MGYTVPVALAAEFKEWWCDEMQQFSVRRAWYTQGHTGRPQWSILQARSMVFHPFSGRNLHERARSRVILRIAG